MSATDEARAQILAGIRRSLKREALGPQAQAALRARLAGPPAHIVPERARREGRARVEEFKRMAEVSLATLAVVRSPGDVPGTVADYLKSQNLPAELRMADDRRLDAIPWSVRPLLRIARGKPDPRDEVGLTGVFAAVAETGTLVMASGAETPATLNFLPETHVVVLRADEIVASYEDMWAKLCASGAGLPRTVNFITGPSRSGDIEQTLQLGAHGPRRLHIVLVDPDGS